ncbi:hypothetical protein [Rhodoferax sp.]|nr:hypothetical protein [Rhodoferax sp.]
MNFVAMHDKPALVSLEDSRPNVLDTRCKRLAGTRHWRVVAGGELAGLI